MFTFFGESRRQHRDGTATSCGKPRIATDRRTEQAAREAHLNTKAFVKTLF